MNDKTFLKLSKKVHKLMASRNKIKFFNLSGAGWKDHYTAKERDRLERYNEKAYAKRVKYNGVVADILVLMVNAGRDIEDIKGQYDPADFDEILMLRDELKPLRNKTFGGK